MKQKDRKTLIWILKQLKGHRLQLVLMVIVSGTMSILSASLAIVMKRLIDGAVNHNYDLLVKEGIILFTMIISIIVLGIISQSITTVLNGKIMISMQQKILAILLQKDYAALTKYHSGELQNRLYSDVGIVVSLMMGLFPSLVALILQFLVAFFILLSIAPMFTIIFILCGIVLFLTMMLVKNKLKYIHKETQQKAGIVRSCIQETLQNLLVIKTFQKEKTMLQQIDEKQQDYFQLQLKRRTISIASGTIFQLISQMGYFLTILYGTIGIYLGNLTYGSLTAMVQLVGQIKSPMSGLSKIISQYYTLLSSSERIIELEQLENAFNHLPIQNDLYQTLDNISLENLTFGYQQKEVLKNIDLKINKGDFISVTGASGCGKSTLFMMLIQAYQPQHGNIYLYSENQRLEKQDMRHLFAYVPQGNYLMSGTVRENVTFFSQDVDDDLVYKALEVACAKQFVLDLPQGLDTLLKEQGKGLSIGQMQRIAIARAIYSQAPILLLDEVTSALDEKTEKEVLKNIQNLKNKTCMIVTHRKAALEICNRHLEFEKGSILEEKR